MSKVTYYKVTDAGNVIFYATGSEPYSKTGLEYLSKLPNGDFPVERLKYKARSGSYGYRTGAEGLRKRAIAKLNEIGVYTLSDFVSYYQKDKEALLEAATFDTCGDGKRYIEAVVTEILEWAPQVVDQSFRPPVIFKLGFNEIKLDGESFPKELDVSELKGGELRQVQRKLHDALKEMAVPLIFDAIYAVRKEQLEKAEADLDRLGQFAEKMALNELLEAVFNR